MSLQALETLAAVLLVYGAFVFTAFVLGFMYVSRAAWWRRWVGRAIFVTSAAMAMLLVSEIALSVTDASVYTDTLVTVIVLALIVAGGTLKLGSLFHEWRRARKSDDAPPL